MMDCDQENIWAARQPSVRRELLQRFVTGNPPAFARTLERDAMGKRSARGVDHSPVFWLRSCLPDGDRSGKFSGECTIAFVQIYHGFTPENSMLNFFEYVSRKE
jgi:hypothetical protein